MNGLISWLSRCPLLVLHAFGAVLGWLAFLGSGVYRRRFMDNARQAGYRFADVRAAVAHTGRMVAELPRLWGGGRVAIEWEGAEVAEAAYASGRGIVFLTPHLGCFEIAAQALAQRFSPRYGALTVLYRPARQAWLRKWMERSRRRPGLEAVPTSLSGVRQMLKALRQGRAVGLLPDQVPPDGLGVWSPVFGRPAYTMTLAARLAQQSGAAVLTIWGERRPGGAGFTVHVRALDAALDGSLEDGVHHINGAMDDMIRQCPGQYLWGYARYKLPRGRE
jgi:Kdo2-lipid IVA lauroyltransferase/acyltransferase